MITTAFLALVGTALDRTPVRADGARQTFEHCRAIPEGPARLRCYDRALPGAPPAPPQEASSDRQRIGSWRLVHTRDPAGGKDAVSIMRTADLTKSDPSFVGLMVRCGESDVEVLPVVIPPLPPRVSPEVSFGEGAKSLTLRGTVVPPGSAILLPPRATEEARSVWRNSKSVAVEITAESETIRGSVPLDDFPKALDALVTACSAR
ncbi:hypothetical protein [Rhodovulum sp. PH10]|uniref:hypothetical protein n=1 Tax=Rhodovulum sp. PH10 TaxID=1187851 RepID=UPI0012FC27F3|nr:hypothetical protein [Rhodovulum sp. PH10]